MVSTKKRSPAKVHKNKSVKIEKKTKKMTKVIHKLPHSELKLTTEDSVPTNSKGNEKKPLFVMPSKYITENIVNSSLRALEQLTVHHKKNNVLFEDEQSIFAVIHCIKIQNCRGNIKL